MSKAVRTYANLVGALWDMQQAATTTSLGKRRQSFKSMEELEAKYKRLNELLGGVDAAFDIYDIARAIRVEKRAELQEYRTGLNKFIEVDMW